MSFAQRVQTHRRAVYQRGTVNCQKCAAPIHVYKLSTIADEFSVRCPKCSSRGIFLKRAVQIEELPERRKKPRR